jgi:hypothetical protein
MNFKALILLLSSSFLLFAQNSFKKYKVKSGMIFYDVKVSSFDNNLNSQVRGIARLVFDDYGLKELKEEDLEEVQRGDFNDTRSKHTMVKIDHGTVYDVDYDEKVIYKIRNQDLDLAIAQKLDLTNELVNTLKKAGAKQNGTKKIAGLECNVWVVNDQELCLYEDSIPLEIRVENAGFLSEQKAVQVVLNRAVPEKDFELPKFKIVEDNELGYSNDSASLVRMQDYLQSVKDLRTELQKKGINLNDKNFTLNPDLEKDIINILGKRYLEKQKKYLKPLIQALEEEKKCMQKANNKEEALACIKPVEAINNKLGDKTNYFHLNEIEKLTPEIKAKIIEQIEQELKDTKVTDACVSKFTKTTEVIECTEGTLKPEN